MSGAAGFLTRHTRKGAVASFYVYINFHLLAESRTSTCAYRTVSSYLKCPSITSGPSIDVGHPLPLMFPAVLADTASHICGVGAVLKVAAASSGEGRAGPHLA
jgi:hypothetical protein